MYAGVCGEVGVGREKGMPKWRSKSYKLSRKKEFVGVFQVGETAYARDWKQVREDYPQIIGSP